MSWSRLRVILGVVVSAILVAGCNSAAYRTRSTGVSRQPTLVAATVAPTKNCALGTTNGYTFILVRGASAADDCQLLLADLAASTVQTWRSSPGQIPPSTSDILYCDLIADTGSRVTVWGGSIKGLGSTICSDLQVGVIPAELTAPTPTPPPTVCSFVYDYVNDSRSGETVVIVRGPAAAAECSSLSAKLPAGKWQLVMGEANVAYRICQGTIGSSSIEVWDTRFTVPPTWTTKICGEIAAGTLGLVSGGSQLSIYQSSQPGIFIRL